MRLWVDFRTERSIADRGPRTEDCGQVRLGLQCPVRANPGGPIAPWAWRIHRELTMNPDICSFAGRLAARLILAAMLLGAGCATDGAGQGGGASHSIAAITQPLPAVPDILPAEYAARRKALMEKLEPGTLLLLPAKPFISDLEPWRQSSDFYYLTGVLSQRTFVLLHRDMAGTLTEILFLTPVPRFEAVFNGPGLTPGPEAAARFGFAQCLSIREAEAKVRQLLPTSQKIAMCLRDIQARGKREERLALLRGIDAKLEQAALQSDLPLINIAPQVAQMRLIKSDAELAQLQRAIDVTGVGLVQAMKFAQPGVAEYQVQGVIESHFTFGGAQRIGFPSIAGAGANSCIPHYFANRAMTRDGDLIVCDVGAEFNMYTADVTRTFPVNGRFTARQRQIYEVVLKAQRAGIQAAKPGATVALVDAAATKVIREAGFERYILHSTSHWLGLDVHDVGAYNQPLKPGMVLTVEPGIYIPEEKIGVRIEDDVLITETGNRVMSAHIPSDPDAIERLMAGAAPSERAGRVLKAFER